MLYGQLMAVAEDGKVEYQLSNFAKWCSVSIQSIWLYMNDLTSSEAVEIFYDASGKKMIRML